MNIVMVAMAIMKDGSDPGGDGHDHDDADEYSIYGADNRHVENHDSSSKTMESLSTSCWIRRSKMDGAAGGRAPHLHLLHPFGA